jgi:ubiquinone/menaquinone biosynthesis C-methylase UbiE
MNYIAEQTLQTRPDFEAIKSKQIAAWASGNYARIGTTLQVVGEELAEAMDLSPGVRVLDIAAGNGNASLAFARRWCDVTSTDFVESLLEQGKARAEAEALDIVFKVADAEWLPFEDGAFDAVVSTFGAMFTPNQQATATEMLRVCRSGGRIGLANWTPDGFIGQMFKVLGQYVTPPPGLQSPAVWGTDSWIRSIFSEDAKDISISPKFFVFRYLTPAHFVDFFRTYYGPVHKAFLSLDQDNQQALYAELIATIFRFNTATDGTMRVPGEYAETIIVKA